MTQTLALSTTPADMIHFAQLLAQLPPQARRTEALRLVGNVITRFKLTARGLTPPVSLPLSLISGVLQARDAIIADGRKLRRWVDDPADFMACLALAAEVTADAIRAEAESRSAA
jgi:hypothetical protein